MSQFDNNKPIRTRWFLVWTGVLSVLLHASLLYYPLQFAHPIPEELTEKAIPPIELSQLPPELLNPDKEQKPKKAPDIREKEIAESEKADNNEEDPNARFLGERNQKVEKEMRAKRTDDYRDKQGTGAKGPKSQDEIGIPPTSDDENAPPEELVEGEGQNVAEAKKAKGVKRNWKTLSLKDLSVGGDGGHEAATDDRLSGVEKGERTILGTREFKFYSYYNRIKDLLRQYWKPSVERKLAKLWSKGKNLGETEITTKVLVLLDDKGTIQKISRVESSGFDEVDSAAIEAFEKAAPFPNPPKGLVEADGFVRVRWDFILKTESAPMIQFRSMGRAGPP